MVPQKVETGDSVKMKQVMDDAVIKAVRLGNPETRFGRIWTHTHTHARAGLIGDFRSKYH